MLFTTVAFVLLFLPLTLFGFFWLGRRSTAWANVRQQAQPAPDHAASGEAGSDGAREHFMALLRAQGIRVVDLAPVFKKHLGHSDRALEVGPYDAQLNQVGLSLVAQAAEEALR